MINKPYKLKRSDFDQIYFTSDTHYQHNPQWNIPLWKLRGFSDVLEHDRWLENEYSMVSEKSIIFHLGDAALNTTPEKMLNLFNKTSAPIWFIFGNHFSPDYALYRSALNLWMFEKGLNLNEKVDVSAPLNYEIYPFNINRNVVHNFGQYNTYNCVPKFFVQGSPGASQDLYSFTYLGVQANIQVDNTLIQLSHMAPTIWTRRSVALFGHSHGALLGVQPFDTDMQRLDCGVENSIKYNKSAFFTFEDVQNIMSKKSAKTYDNHHH